MKLKPKISWMMQNFQKQDIAAALVLSRENLRAELDKSASERLEIFEIKQALGLLPENNSHKEVMDHIRILVNGEDVGVTEGPQTGTS